MNKILLAFIVFFNLISIFYLISPTPVVGDLPDSVRSNLPGDTVQLRNVSAYFTNLSRTEVITFFKANYNGPLRIFLNHPPEKSKDIFVDTMQSYYLEEFVLPFKESIFINGFEWQNDVFTKPQNRLANKLIYQGIEYKSKITIKKYPVPVLSRLIVFFLTEFSIFTILILYKNVIRKTND